MKSIKSMMMGGAILFSLSMMFTSCEGALDDILGEWSRPTPGNNTPSGGDSDSGGGSSTVVASSLSITETTLRLDKSTSQTLTLTVTPADATVTWESKDETVATVDASGKVTPKKAGKVTITAKSGDLDDTSTIYIYDKIWNINTDGNADVTAGESWLIEGNGTAVSKGISIEDGATVTLNDINITQQLSCSGDATIILADGSDNKVTGTGNKAGIKLGGTGTTLNINAETAGTGKLTAEGGYNAAGIGTELAYGYHVTGGNIIINGGTVNAQGGYGAAGIGTGFSQENSSDQYGNNTCGAITIAAGVKSVTATKGYSSPYCIGIGNSYPGSAQTCGVIKFGTVEVYDGAGNWAALTDGNTYGGLKLAISGDTWTLTPAP